MKENKINKDAIARQYAKSIGHDTIRPAGTKDEWDYYHTLNIATLRHKLGLPNIIKINNAGQIAKVEVLKERMWAIQQEASQL